MIGRPPAAVPFFLLVCGMVSASDGMRTLNPGRSLSGRLSGGDDVFAAEFTAEKSGPFTIEAHSLVLDTYLKVFRVTPDGGSFKEGEDEDGGPGQDSRLVLQAEKGSRFRIEVSAGEKLSCGLFLELSIAPGQLVPLVGKARKEADSAYWDAADKAAADTCMARALVGRADSLRVMGAGTEAKPVAERALSFAKERLASSPIWEAHAAQMLGIVLRESGSYKEARPLLERALAIKQQSLGPEDVGVSESIDQLATLLQKIGDYAEAKPLFERALSIREKRMGPDHFSTASSINNLAICLDEMGYLAEAEPLLRRALWIYEQQLGPNHLYVGVALNNLANHLKDTGSYPEAKSLYERAMRVYEQNLGPEHPDLARVLVNAGILCRIMGSYAEAKPLYERALAIQEKTLGPTHPSVAETLANMAMLLRDQGDLVAAKPLIERSLAIREERLGPEDRAVASSLTILGVLERRQGDAAAAKPLLERALAIRRKALALDNPLVAISLENLGADLRDLGSPTDARGLYEEALEINTKKLGPDHPRVGRDYADLASVLLAGGATEEAFSAALRAEAIGREHLKLTSRTLAESEALRFASVRIGGLDLALSIAAMEGAGAAKRNREAWNELIRSRAVVLDEMAARHHLPNEPADAVTAHLTAELLRTSRRYANLLVQGADSSPPERVIKQLEEARKDRNQAERSLAEQSVAFRKEQVRTESGLAEVEQQLEPDSALVAFARYDRWPVPAAPVAEKSNPGLKPVRS